MKIDRGVKICPFEGLQPKNALLADIGQGTGCSLLTVGERKNATCTEVGKTVGKKCAVCGEILVAQKVIPALGHDMSEFVVIRNSTCKEKGESRSTCSKCGYTETRMLPLTEHTDADGDGHCDDCEETIGTQTSCNCICHGHGIKTLIYKILLVVQKIIQIDLVNRVMHIGRVCKCGEIHY